MIVDKSSYVQQLKDLNKGFITDENFRNMFGANALSEQKALSTLQYDYNNAINEAYKSHLLSNDAISSSALGTGYKQEMLKANQDALLDAFAQYKTSYQTSQQSVVDEYGKVTQSLQNLYAQQEENIANQSEILAKYFDKHYDYASYLYENNPDTFNQYDFFNVFLNADGSFKTRNDLFKYDVRQRYNPETGQIENIPTGLVNEDGSLTDKGLKYLDYLENTNFEDALTWSEYLYNEDRDLYDWTSNYNSEYGYSGFDLFRNITGRDVGDINSYASAAKKTGLVDEEFYDAKIEDVAYNWENEFVDLTEANVIDDTYMDEDGLETLTSSKWKLDNNTSYTVEEFKSNWRDLVHGTAGFPSGRREVIDAAVKAAEEGTLKNGTIIDINAGGGEGRLYAYWNGKFVKLAKPGEVVATADAKVSKDFNAIPSEKVTELNLDTEQNIIDPSTMNSDDVYTLLGNDVKITEDGTNALTRLLDISKNWDSSMNGTYVDFNYGWTAGGKGTVYVFYDGKWYPTNYDRSSAWHDLADDKFYTMGGISWLMRGTDFHKTFDK